jgi:hypothetical protein
MLAEVAGKEMAGAGALTKRVRHISTDGRVPTKNGIPGRLL